jgi:hypothetical protein
MLTFQRLLDIPIGYEMELAVDYNVESRTYRAGTKLLRSEGFGCAGYAVSFTFPDGFSDWMTKEELRELK